MKTYKVGEKITLPGAEDKIGLTVIGYEPGPDGQLWYKVAPDIDFDDENENGHQQNNDVLLVLSRVGLPMEGLIKKGDEPAEQSDGTGPHAKSSAPNQTASDTDDN